MYVKSAILLSSLVASSLAAQSVARRDAPATASGTDKADKKICRSVETTGSIFRTKTCHTQTEWSAIDAGNAQGSRYFTDNRPRAGSISLR